MKTTFAEVIATGCVVFAIMTAQVKAQPLPPQGQPLPCAPAHQQVNTVAQTQHIANQTAALNAHQSVAVTSGHIFQNTMAAYNQAHGSATTQEEHSAIESSRQQFLEGHNERTQTAHENISQRAETINENIQESAANHHGAVEHNKIKKVSHGQQVVNNVASAQAHKATEVRSNAAFKKGIDYFNSCCDTATSEEERAALEYKRQEFIANHHEKTSAVHGAIANRSQEIRKAIQEKAIRHHEAIESRTEEIEAAATVEDGF